MGLRLPSLFAEAGLVPGDRFVSRAVVLNQDPKMMVAMVRSLLPTLIANGITKSDEVDIDTLEGRLQAEATPYGLANVATVIGCHAVKR